MNPWLLASSPLRVSAHHRCGNTPRPCPALQVEMADMELDYGALVWQQRLALKNMPAGYTRIVLSAEDLGHFMTHPIFMQVAASAINVR